MSPTAPPNSSTRPTTPLLPLSRPSSPLLRSTSTTAHMLVPTTSNISQVEQPGAVPPEYSTAPPTTSASSQDLPQENISAQSSETPTGQLQGTNSLPTNSGPTFSIRPSSVLKVATMTRLKGGSSVRHDTLELRLAADMYKLQQNHKIRRASQRRLAAEGKLTKTQYFETAILTAAAEKGSQWTHLEPQLAMGLANATQNALKAEEEVVHLQILEYMEKVEALRILEEDIHTRFLQATEQVDAISKNLEQRHITVQPLVIKISPPPPAAPENGSPNFTSDSDSDLYTSDSELSL